ncbi:hypothetical protein CAPTEDRAFT_203604 [Capitella teleta]|uniref:Transmembrane protein n=1 Tax=Capitella teleta TaxID=283909 RepID=R7UE86_CAPTE|nr:hypothetical protein CAPTEDRAFT_203604 [Capitella teleta]|eukprot:ELU02098.1 hypothetical protein CAPTEDRAFT_203604 [Capitella teleta]
MIGTVTRILDLVTDRDAKRQTALKILTLELIICIVGFAVGLRAYILVTNNSAGAFWAHNVLIIGVLFLYIGLLLKRNGVHWLTGGIVLNGVGAILAFIAIIMDGVQGGYLSNTNFHNCVFATTSGTALCEIPSPGENIYMHCPLNYNANTCFCCEIYREHSCNGFPFSISTSPDRFEDVISCDQVEGEFQVLLWTSMGMNLLNFILSIIACAAVSVYKNTLSVVSPWNGEPPNEPVFRTQVMPSSGPVVLFTQHQSVGYYPNGTPTLLMPPSYTSVVNLSQVPTQPGTRSGHNIGQSPQSYDSLPPPYSP